MCASLARVSAGYERLLAHDHHDDGVDLLGDGVIELLRLKRRIERALHHRDVEPVGFGGFSEAAGHAADEFVGDRPIEKGHSLAAFRPGSGCGQSGKSREAGTKSNPP